MEREVLSYCRICAAACGIAVTVDGERVGAACAATPSTRSRAATRARRAAASPPGTTIRDRLDRPRAARPGGRVGRGPRRPRGGAARHASTAFGRGCGRASTSPPGWRTTRRARSRPASFLGALGSTLVLLRGHRRQRAGARGGGAGHRQRDAEPACGTRRTPGLVPPRGHQPGGVARLRHRAARPGELPARLPSRRRARLGGRPAAHRDRGARPTSTSPPGPGATSSCSRRWRARAARATAPTPTSCATTARPTTSTRCGAVLAPFTVARAATAAGIDVAALDALVDDLRAHRGRVAVSCGTGALMGADGILVEWLKWVLLIVTGSLDRPGGMRFSRGTVHPLRPPRTDGHRARRARARPAAPSSRGSPTRSRPSRSPTRSKPATSAC